VEPTAAGAGRGRRFGEILEELIADCAALGGDPSTAVPAALDALVAVLDAEDAVLVRGDGVVLTSTDAEPALAPTLQVPTSGGGRLGVRWAEPGAATITRSQLSALGLLICLVADIASARAESDARFEEMRHAWGQEIHDGVTRSVTAAIGALERVRLRIGDPAVSNLLETTEQHVHQSLVDLRDVLECAVDEHGRLVSAEVGETLREVVDDVRTRWRLQARITVRGDLAGVGGELAGAARAVVREALINVAKHAGAGRVTVTASVSPSELRVSVTDDGVGVGVDATDGSPSVAEERGFQLGLRLLEQRVDLAGGTLTVTPAHGGGTEVLAILPRR